MRPLELNLASSPFRNNTLLWAGHALLAGAVVAFTAWNTVTFVEMGRRLDQLRNAVGSVDNRMIDVEKRERTVDARITKHDVRFLSTQAFRANEVIERRAFSWTRLFNLLEGVQPYEIKMTSIRPVFGAEARTAPAAGDGGRTEVVPVSVEGSAKTIRAFFELEDALIGDPHFDRIAPSRSTHAKNGEVIFGLSFLYYPDGLRSKTKRDAAPESAVAGDGPAPEGAPAPSAAATPPAAADPLTEPTVTPPAPPPPNVAAKAPASAPANAQPGTDADSAAEPAPVVRKYRKPERRPPPPGPIRKRPEGWQPPDPFADRKKGNDR